MIEAKIDYPGEPQYNYPLMLKDSSGNIVLFTKPTVGTLLHDVDSGVSVGCHSNMWDMSTFRYFHEELILKNKQ